MLAENPVTVITINDGVAETWYSNGHEPLIVDFDTIRHGRSPENASEYIEAVLTLPIDTIFRIRLIEDIFWALGQEPADCLSTFNEAAENIGLMMLEEVVGLRDWAGWLTIEQNRDVDGNFICVVVRGAS